MKKDHGNVDVKEARAEDHSRDRVMSSARAKERSEAGKRKETEIQFERSASFFLTNKEFQIAKRKKETWGRYNRRGVEARNSFSGGDPCKPPDRP